MAIRLDILRAGGSCYSVEEGASGFFIHLKNNDRANFNLIVRGLLDGAGDGYLAFARSDGFGGYDSVHIIPFAEVAPGPAPDPLSKLRPRPGSTDED